MKKRKAISPEDIQQMIEDAARFMHPIVLQAEEKIRNGNSTVYGTYLKVLSEFDDPLQRGITAMGLVINGANPVGVSIAMEFCELQKNN